VSYGRATVSEQYVNFVKTLIKQMEIAGFLFAGYTCLTLFFPSPLIIFKASILSNIRSIIFGARKYTFIASSLALWWGVQFFRSFKFVKYFEVYMKVFLQDPCVARQDYLAAIGGNYSTVCHSMLSAQSEWSNANKTIHDILHISEPMVSTCCGPYPYKNLNISIFTDNDSGHEAAMKEYGFDYDKSGGSFCRDVVGCYLPSEDPVGAFLGNLTACEDNNFVRREIMKLNEASTISGWDIWISSGVISSILLSAGIATFGVYLVKLADPFMSCGGKYEGPPKNFNFQDSELSTLMEEKKIALETSAMGGVAFWGVLTNLMMLNVVFGRNAGPTEEDEDEFRKDAAAAAALIVFSFFPIGIAMYASRMLFQKSQILSGLYTEHRNRNLQSDQSEACIDKGEVDLEQVKNV